MALPAIALLASLLWIDVPFVRQDERGCGAASIAMVLQYWQLKGSPIAASAADPTHILKLLYSEADDGILASDVVRYFEDNGFTAIAFTGSWNDLEHHVKRGRPLIAALRAKGNASRFHYLVVAGIDLDADLILVNDPAQRKLLKMTRSIFEQRWAATDKWTLLAVPRQ